MHIKKILFLLSLIPILFLSFCSSNKEIENTNKERVLPNNLRIIGTIEQIAPLSTKPGLCSTYPCTAFVKIEKVVERGLNFNTPVVKSDVIKIRFEFTLEKTSKELFPELNNQLPGLKVGDTFIADVEEIKNIQLNKNYDKFEYKIFTYKIIK